MHRILMLLLIIQISLTACGNNKESIDKTTLKNRIFVSILPQKYFVKKICGDGFDVRVMVRAGESPATYEPTPQQMVALSKSKIYFSIGVPFEKLWLKKIAESNKNLLISDTSESAKFRHVKNFNELKEIIAGNKKMHSGKHAHLKDPHIWLDPVLVIDQAKIITETLIKIDPENSELFRNNLNKFTTELKGLHFKIYELFKKKKNRIFFVFHPSWGYFADRYNLIQIPVELQGRKPGPKELSSIINIIKKYKTKTVFVQKQFSTAEAKTIASALDGKVKIIDPLEENYMTNLIFTAQKIAKSME